MAELGVGPINILKLLASLLSLFCFGALPAQSSEMQRYILHCSAKENPLLKVKIDYDIKNLIKDSFSQYFKEKYSEDPIGSVSGGCSIGCGFGSSLYSSISVSAEDRGLEVSMDIKRTGNNPVSYQKTFFIPWKELKHDESDSRSTIKAVVTWRKAQQGAAANP